MKEQMKYIIIGTAILLSAIIISISLYAIQTQKSKSIEKQKEQEYFLKRFEECYKIYKDGKMTGPVTIYLGREYDKIKDKCVIDRGVNGFDTY